MGCARAQHLANHAQHGTDVVAMRGLLGGVGHIRGFGVQQEQLIARLHKESRPAEDLPLALQVPALGPHWSPFRRVQLLLPEQMLEFWYTDRLRLASLVASPASPPTALPSLRFRFRDLDFGRVASAGIKFGGVPPSSCLDGAISDLGARGQGTRRAALREVDSRRTTALWRCDCCARRARRLDCI